MLDTIFTVKNEHLEKLSADETVSFFANLLWAEARRLGLTVTSINISSHINVPDGGIDATMDCKVPSESGVVKRGRTVFQLKAGNFRPWQLAEIRNELFGKGNPVVKDRLGTTVRASMDAGAKYVLVCTGSDLTGSEPPKRNHF